MLRWETEYEQMGKVGQKVQMSFQFQSKSVMGI